MADDVVRHKWKKANRTEIGGKTENMTIVQVMQFHGPIEEVIW